MQQTENRSPAADTEIAGISTSRTLDSIDPVEVNLRLQETRVHPGETVTLELAVDIDAGWHIHGTEPRPGVQFPTIVSLKLPAGVKEIGDWEILSPVPILTAPGSAVGYDGAVTFRTSSQVTSDAAPGKLEVKCELSYQACDDRFCLQPTTTSATAILEVVAE